MNHGTMPTTGQHFTESTADYVIAAGSPMAYRIHYWDHRSKTRKSTQWHWTTARRCTDSPDGERFQGLAGSKVNIRGVRYSLFERKGCGGTTEFTCRTDCVTPVPRDWKPPIKQSLTTAVSQ